MSTGRNIPDMVPSPLRTLREMLADDVWRFALVVGGFAAVSVGLDYWQMPSEGLDFSVVVFAGLVGGYLFHDRPETPSDVGLRVGFVASAPVLLQTAEPVGYILGLGQPPWATVLQGLLLVAYVLIAATLVGLSGVAGALAGNWLARKTSREPQPAAGN